MASQEISPKKEPKEKDIDMKVKVALRIRPLISRDMTEDCQIIIECNTAEKYVISPHIYLTKNLLL